MCSKEPSRAGVGKKRPAKSSFVERQDSQDFKKIDPKFNLLSYPVTVDIDREPEELQLGLLTCSQITL
jgi:hypothetical protein